MTRAEEYKYDRIIELEIATENEISLVKRIVSGTWNEVLDAIVYARTGYNTLEQYIECELREDEE